MASAAEILESLETEFPNTVQQRVRAYSLKDAYKTVSWVYACCNLIADSISGVEFFFGRKDSLGVVTRVPEDRAEPVVYCFYPPRWGEIPTLAEMIKMMFLHLGLFGETFIFLQRKGKYPVEIDIVNPLNITPIISKDGTKIDAWKIKQQLPGGQTKEIKVAKDDIVQWKYPNPYNKFRGMAPLTAARLSIEQDLNMATWNAGFFQNGLRNPIALLLKQTFNEPQRKEYMARLRQNFMGFVKGQLPLLVEGGVGVQVLSNTMKDLDFVEGKELTREELAAVYGTPPALVGIYRYANYANVKEQTRIFYNANLKPKMTYFRDLFQQSILDVHFPGVVCDWEWESVDAFREDPAIVANVDETNVRTATALWAMGYTQPQIAYILKRPDLDPATHVTATQIDPEIPEPEIPKNYDPPRLSHSRTHLVLYASDGYLRQHATAAFNGPIRDLSQRLNSFVHSFVEQAASTLRSSSSAVKQGFWQGQWEQGVTPILQQAYREGVLSAYQDLRLTPPTPNLIKSADPVISVQDVGSSIVQKLQGSEVLKRKATGAKLAEACASAVEKFPSTRMIHRLYNLGRYETLVALKVDDVKWCCGLSDEHRNLHGVTAKLGETFPIAEYKFPGESGKDDCTCTIFPVSVRKAEEKVVIRA